MEPRGDATGPILRQIAKDQIARSFGPEYRSRATEEEGIGIAVAQHFKWDGISILKTFANALEEANYHGWSKAVGDWIEELGHER